MSNDRPSGPQLVATASQRIEGCPHWNTGLSLIEDLIPEGGTAVERLRHFAVAKTVSDVLADRLPNMQDKYPPHGLPEIYREPWMEEPEWRPLESLSYSRLNADPVTEGLGALLSAYGSKVIVHFYNELENMQDDPEHKAVVEGLANEAMLPIPGQEPSNAEQAYEIIGRPAVDNLDLMVGFMAVAPAVLETGLDRQPTHEEVIAALKVSRRLTILPTLLARSQFGHFLVGTTVDNMLGRTHGIWDLDPAHFDAAPDYKGDFVIDYKDGIGGIKIPDYKLDSGEFGDAFLPTVVRGSVDASQAKLLEETAKQREVLTCPSRKLITAMWKDLIEVADKERIFARL